MSSLNLVTELHFKASLNNKSVSSARQATLVVHCISQVGSLSQANTHLCTRDGHAAVFGDAHHPHRIRIRILCAYLPYK